MNKRSFSKSTLIHVTGGMVATGGNVLLAPVYLRLLNANDYGAWSSFLLATQVLQSLLTWGLFSALSRLLVNQDIDQRSRLIAGSIHVATCFNLVFITALAFCSVVLQKFAPAELLNLHLFAATSAALCVYPAILTGVYISDNDALQYRMVGISWFILQGITLALANLWGPFGVHRAVVAMLLASSIYAFLAIFKLFKMISGSRPRAADYLVLLSLGIPVVLYTVLGQISDFIIRGFVATHVSIADFGAYSAGLLLSSVISMGASAVNLAWIPIYYRNANAWNESGIYGQFVEVFAASTALAAAFMIIFSQELLSAYSGGNIQLPTSVMSGLVIASWLNSAVWMSLSNPLFQQLRMRSVLTVVVVATCISLPLAWLLIKRFDMLGASWSMAINALIICSLAASLLRFKDIGGATYSRLGFLLLILLILSGPWLNGVYGDQIGWQRVMSKSLLMTAVVGLIGIFFLRRGINVIKKIEAELKA